MYLGLRLRLFLREALKIIGTRIGVDRVKPWILGRIDQGWTGKVLTLVQGLLISRHLIDLVLGLRGPELDQVLTIDI